MLANEDNPFHSLEHDQDPIMIAARRQSQSLSSSTISIQWRYCSEGVFPSVHRERTESPLNLIALGRTGDGKSSLLNDLLGHQAFKQKISAKSQTKEIQSSEGFWAPLHPYMHNKKDFGCPIRVIDTPGFGDSQMRDKEFFSLIQQALLDAANEKGGIHCILMVFKITTK
ncbi:uncharacterized protein B0P05DRAFT_558258 [Gilbertella persicaria]|uniref:AIG1-type G domain-containing protein n=1 Tax=Rhizopus stolonifer TaxID=4846 RepID=A0A367KNJ4_RHIST|nr:uncharacterized protein B0P05DRAFT_558258 [Gilbertella persicaria]KAI8059974.1 hypothetical protein B0P05DRAFT_558258 [Gilbertella persicaria]RCI03700.1 hypothetical protein CU098_012132 [Rhizopus stolonifer]